MRNVDEASQIIAEAVGDTMLTDVAAKALADAGLLMPDLPEPVEKFTTGDASWTLVGKAAVDSWHDDGGPVVALRAGRGRYLTPAEARQLAYILLAAANHAEGEKPSPKSVDELPLLRPSTVEEENAIREKYGLPLIRKDHTNDHPLRRTRPRPH